MDTCKVDLNELVQPCCPFTASMRCCTLCAARARHGDGCAQATSCQRQRVRELQRRDTAQPGSYLLVDRRLHSFGIDIALVQGEGVALLHAIQRGLQACTCAATTPCSAILRNQGAAGKGWMRTVVGLLGDQ